MMRATATLWKKTSSKFGLNNVLIVPDTNPETLEMLPVPTTAL